MLRGLEKSKGHQVELRRKGLNKLNMTLDVLLLLGNICRERMDS